MDCHQAHTAFPRSPRRSFSYRSLPLRAPFKQTFLLLVVIIRPAISFSSTYTHCTVHFSKLHTSCHLHVRLLLSHLRVPYLPFRIWLELFFTNNGLHNSLGFFYLLDVVNIVPPYSLVYGFLFMVARCTTPLTDTLHTY